MNSESQEKTLGFHQHACAVGFCLVFYCCCFFGREGGEVINLQAASQRPTCCHTNESSPSALNRPFFVAGALLGSSRWGSAGGFTVSGPVVPAAH